jgi:hypothetical protein
MAAEETLYGPNTVVAAVLSEDFGGAGSSKVMLNLSGVLA